MTLSQAKGRWMNLSAMVIFGTIGIFVRSISLPSSFIALVRGCVGVIFLSLVLLLRRQRPDFSAIRRNLPRLLLSGVFLGANWVALFQSYHYTSVATATMCYYMAPILVLLLSPVLLKEKLTGFHLGCVAAALAGMTLVTAPWKADAGSMAGICWGLAAACLYAGVILVNRSLSGLTSFDTTLVQLGASFLVLLPYVLLTEDVTGFALTGPTLGMLALVGVVHTGLAYTLYFGSIPALSARTVALYSYLDPVLAVILSALVLKEPLDLPGIAGIVLVLAATAANDLKKS